MDQNFTYFVGAALLLIIAYALFGRHRMGADNQQSQYNLPNQDQPWDMQQPSPQNQNQPWAMQQPSLQSQNQPWAIQQPNFQNQNQPPIIIQQQPPIIVDRGPHGYDRRWRSRDRHHL
jgi:hypothetical protein